MLFFFSISSVRMQSIFKMTSPERERCILLRAAAYQKYPLICKLVTLHGGSMTGVQNCEKRRQKVLLVLIFKPHKYSVLPSIIKSTLGITSESPALALFDMSCTSVLIRSEVQPETNGPFIGLVSFHILGAGFVVTVAFS